MKEPTQKVPEPTTMVVTPATVVAHLTSRSPLAKFIQRAMKLHLPAILACSCCAAGAQDPKLPTFDEKIGVPPLSLRESVRTELPRPKEQLKFTVPAPGPETALKNSKVVSQMPVITPNPEVDKNMPIVRPDPSVDYKLRLVEPQVESVRTIPFAK